MRVKNFLKSSSHHQHKDPTVRRESLDQLDAVDSDSQAIIIELASNDPDVTVRTAAIAKLTDLAALRELLDANGDSAEAIRGAAESRLSELLEQDAVSDIAVRALLASHAPRLAVSIASCSAAKAQREMALDAITEESSLLDIVQQTRSHDTRLAAASRLTKHDTIRAALTAVRSRDKVVAKQLQQRLDEEAAREAARIATTHAVGAALQSAEELSESVWSPQFKGRYQELEQRWKAFDEADIADRDLAFKTAMNKAGKVLAEHEEKVAGEAKAEESALADTSASEKSAEGVAPVIVEHSAELKGVIEKLGSSDIEALSANLETLKGDMSDLPADASKLVQHAEAIAVLFNPPFEMQKARPGTLKQRMKRVEALLDTETLLPGVDVAKLDYMGEFKAHLPALQNRMGKAEQESADRVKATHRQFAALSGIIKEGKWGPANSMMRRLQKKIEAMEPAERSGLDDKLNKANVQLTEMADWQDFAARPKLEALCESMEALPSKSLTPEPLAKEVRELQKSWKSLGVSRASNELWSRFKTAGDVAYEPCKAWFDEKQKLRQQKLDAKAALCDELEAEAAKLGEDTVDYKAIQKRVNIAKREWTKNRVQDRKPDKALEARFSDALKPFDTVLAEQYDANASAKQALVEKVAALAEGEINQHSANQAKRLLSAWKLVGVMRRKEDQALWEVFNGHLGTIFKHQNKVERDKKRAGLEHVFRAKDIIKKLKSLARADTIDEGEVQGLATEFQGLAEFPERDKKFLLRDFRSAIDACGRVQDKASKRRVHAEYEERMRLVGLCEQLELAVEDPTAASDTLRDDVVHGWDSTETRLGREVAVKLEARRDSALSHLDNGTQPDYSANEEMRRDLLIKMEVAADIETPADDKSRRMQYQLANLQAGMSSASEDKKTVLAELEGQWLAAPPVRQVIKDSLQSRYLKACKR